MKYKGIIFDLDGVICSTDECHYQAWKKLADEIGAAGFNREDNARQRGVSRMESLEVVLEKAPHQYTQEEKAALAEHKNDFLAAATAIAVMPLEYKLATAALVLLRYGVVFAEIWRITRRLGERGLRGAYFVYDLLSPFYEMLVALLCLRRDDRVWR